MVDKDGSKMIVTFRNHLRQLMILCGLVVLDLLEASNGQDEKKGPFLLFSSMENEFSNWTHSINQFLRIWYLGIFGNKEHVAFYVTFMCIAAAKILWVHALFSKTLN